MYECLEPLLFLHFCDELVGFCHGFGNVVADMVVADEPVYIRLFESGVYRGIDPRQNDMYLLFLRRGNQDFEVVDSRRIDKRYFSHTDNAHQRTIGHTTHQFVELGGYPEEELAFYLVNFHAFGYFQDFVGSRFGSGRNIEPRRGVPIFAWSLSCGARRGQRPTTARFRWRS